MVSGTFVTLLGAVLAAVKFVGADANPATLDARATDPCAAIGGQKWVAPSDVRKCFTSFAVDPTIKANVSALSNSPACKRRGLT